MTSAMVRLSAIAAFHSGDCPKIRSDLSPSTWRASRAIVPITSRIMVLPATPRLAKSSAAAIRRSSEAFASLFDAAIIGSSDVTAPEAC